VREGSQTRAPAGGDPRGRTEGAVIFENFFAFLGPMSSALVLVAGVLCVAILPMSHACPLRQLPKP